MLLFLVEPHDLDSNRTCHAIKTYATILKKAPRHSSQRSFSLLLPRRGESPPFPATPAGISPSFLFIMVRKTFFILGGKSFEIIEESQGIDRWFSWIERSRRFTSQVKIDEENLRWVCEQMHRASKGQGNLCRRWGTKIQTCLYRVYQNFNSYGRFLRIETWTGDRRKAIIIPEMITTKDGENLQGKNCTFWGKLLIPNTTHSQLCTIDPS